MRQLPTSQHLPLDGVDAQLPTMVVAKDGSGVVGAAAVELHADGALLRSVVVSPLVQGQGLGRQLSEAALESRGATASPRRFAHHDRRGLLSVWIRTDLACGRSRISSGVCRNSNRRARRLRPLCESASPDPMTPSLRQRLVSEALGTALLLAAGRSGSGIMAERLSAGNQALALLANTVATGAALVALILTFGAISGAHFNPAVTVADASQGDLPARDAARLHRRASRGRGRRCVVGARDVSGTNPDALAAPAIRRRAAVQRVRRHIWSSLSDLGLLASSSRGRSVRRRGLHHGSLLVYRLDVVRESRGDVRPCALRYVCRHLRPADVPGFVVAAIRRRDGRDVAVSMARPVLAWHSGAGGRGRLQQ